MSQENVEVVRQMYDAFHSGDADGALAHLTRTWSSMHPGPDRTAGEVRGGSS
jgi:ketosteroid isomerase-like protein